MTAAVITQLLLAFGPSAIGLIQQLVAVWNKPSLTVDEVNSICSVVGKSYEQYIKEAGGIQPPLPNISAIPS